MPNNKSGFDHDTLVERAAEAFSLDYFRKNPPQEWVAPAPSQPEQAPDRVVAPVKAPMPTQPGRAAPVCVDLAQLKDRGFIIPGAPTSILSEEIRLIKRTLLLTAFGGNQRMPIENGRLIQVCSAQPNEGKTFTAINLALSLACERDIEVLLVDADVAKPEILSTLGLYGTKGLMDALLDPHEDVERLILQTDIAKLSVLPAGRASSQDTEAMASAHAHQVIQQLGNNSNRVVVFDSAPALAASPSGALAHHVGQMLMVVRADQTPEDALREAIGLLDGCPNLHLCINSVTYHGTARKYGAYYGLGD
ncbi:MAG: AAA family ATPase [Alphaproteobacteria bacterium]|nr:AAA family ATPase [Alphaproteobacteria bacterium]